VLDGQRKWNQLHACHSWKADRTARRVVSLNGVSVRQVVPQHHPTFADNALIQQCLHFAVGQTMFGQHGACVMAWRRGRCQRMDCERR
jgi:hypothetical protein